MNKSELVSEISEISGLTKIDSEKALDAFMRVVENALSEGDEIRLVGFGTFSVVSRSATIGRNPRTNEEVQIPARKMPKFKPGLQLKECVNKK